MIFSEDQEIFECLREQEASRHSSKSVKSGDDMAYNSTSILACFASRKLQLHNIHFP